MMLKVSRKTGNKMCKRNSKKKRKKLPFFFKSTLWSYNIEKLDIEENKRIIIENVLNHGGDREVKWLLRTYSEDEIISVLKDPSRGFWDRESLNFWCEIFNVKIGKGNYEKAIKKIYPKHFAS